MPILAFNTSPILLAKLLSQVLVPRRLEADEMGILIPHDHGFLPSNRSM